MWPLPWPCRMEDSSHRCSRMPTRPTSTRCQGNKIQALINRGGTGALICFDSGIGVCQDNIIDFCMTLSACCCRNWADLVKRARSKQLKPDEFNSGNFSISNLGMYGVETFDAILPPGEIPLFQEQSCKYRPQVISGLHYSSQTYGIQILISHVPSSKKILSCLNHHTAALRYCCNSCCWWQQAHRGGQRGWHDWS